MPDFLDFVFPFGESEHAQDFHFSGFRAENQFSKDSGGERGLAVPALGRSGRQFQMCFNLRSVEPIKYNQDWPWSIRQAAIYHSFDVETGRTVWIFVKGNDLIRRRIQSAVSNGVKTESNDIASFDSLTAAFGSSLNVHTILCEWARENWRWYINFLEEFFQGQTRRSLHATVDTPARHAPKTTTTLARSYTTPPPAVKRRETMASIGRSQLNKLRRAVSFKPPSPDAGPDSNAVPLQTLLDTNKVDLSEEKEFSFEKLQLVQKLEEKATETLLVLKTNMDVLAELKDCYARFQVSQSWPDELKTQAKDRLDRFETRVASAISGLSMEKSRLETLVRHISNRKTLVSARHSIRVVQWLTRLKLTGILDSQNVNMHMEIAQRAQASAEKAQVSADNMEKLTSQMRRIAEKTEQETVSMRIVTYLALFFLPGTFISVSNWLYAIAWMAHR
jgi:hypothetical protein